MIHTYIHTCIQSKKHSKLGYEMNGTAIHMQLFAHENVINTKKSDMAVNTLLSLSEPHYPVHNNPS